MAREALATNNLTKGALAFSSRSGRFGIGVFGSARFGNRDGLIKEALATNSFTKEAVTNQIT